ncbi:rho1p [Lichtheimia corymbifera JMRC:FSU:9682]|uniref:Rho1p n=1 Tax=Lichtheimia corymbifera JMRC:FSU:9682 TaxID=1263082 RepID=A0A068RLN8_9FUNG|nr:rho1p [Lichtheimia corymbifera JMRC:FSU:9682]
MVKKPLSRRFVIVGDGACGKTCMLHVYAKGYFPTEYIPTIFDTFVKPTHVDGRQVNLELWDTAGQELYDRLRMLAYPDSDVIIIAYDISDPETLANIPEKWLPEVQYNSNSNTFFLVGCKRDLRDDPDTLEALRKRGMTTVSYQQGQAMADTINARGYYECSAKLNQDIAQVFEQAARATIPKHPFCVLL